ncbi:MAG: dTDP-4-dehydrorhamnose reductase [bacterium]|nr:dTDP-4-dehydrorhamnose reductase [bacterium]
MKILIIGSKGMLGQALVKVFSAGNEVLAWDREEIDITEAQSSNIKIQNLRPDLVINAAAYNNVDGAETERELAQKINGYAVGYLSKTCKGLDIPLVHYSTDYVFDGTNRKGYKESDFPNPVSAYGESKFLGERELQKNTDKFYLIRLSRLFGKEAYIASAKKSFVNLMLDLAKNHAELEAVDEEISCPTHAVDVAERTRYIAESKPEFGIYHAANVGSATWFEFAAEIFKIKQIDVKLKPVPASRFPRPAMRPQHSVLLNTKLPPMRSWKEALKEFLISN